MVTQSSVLVLFQIIKESVVLEELFENAPSMNLHTAYFAFYVIVPIAGIALNGYVLWRLIRIAR